MVAPEVDDRVLRMQWWLPPLVLSLFVLPPFVGSLWLGDPTVRVSGQTHFMTLAEKLVVTSIAAVWLGVLLFARYRHRRRLRAALVGAQTDPR